MSILQTACKLFFFGLDFKKGSASCHKGTWLGSLGEKLIFNTVDL